MSWLSEHVRHFVVPCIRALRYDTTGATLRMCDVDFDKVLNVRPCKSAKHREAGYVAAALASLGFQGYKHAWIIRGNVADWAPALRPEGFERMPINSVVSYAHTFLYNALKSIRGRIPAGGRLILTGRDTHLFNVQAQQMGIETVYDPRVSRDVARSPCLKGILDEIQLTDRDVMMDTGWCGSIPTSVQRVTLIKPACFMMSSINSDYPQVFPFRKGARELAIYLERMPKYFTSGRVVKGQVEQHLSSLDEFLMAAAMTIWWFHHRSSRFIPMARTRRPGRRRHPSAQQFQLY